MTKRRRAVSAVLAALSGLPALALGAQSAPGPDPEATAILRAMTDHLAGLQRFSVNGHGILEVVLTSGQKLQFDKDVTEGFYAAAQAPTTIDAALDFARDELDLIATAGDLIYSDA
jgi:hypothetical protein